MRVIVSIVIAASAWIGLQPSVPAIPAPRVELLGLPQGGLQPQAVTDERAVLHVLFFKGAPAGGDLYYMRRRPEAREFSTPLRVNSVPGSALATGSVRGRQRPCPRGLVRGDGD